MCVYSTWMRNSVSSCRRSASHRSARFTCLVAWNINLIRHLDLSPSQPPQRKRGRGFNLITSGFPLSGYMESNRTRIQDPLLASSPSLAMVLDPSSPFIGLLPAGTMWSLALPCSIHTPKQIAVLRINHPIIASGSDLTLQDQILGPS